MRMPQACRVAAGLTALVIGVAAGAPAVRAGGAPLTLADAVRRALREGREAKIARLEADQAHQAVQAARSVYWPQAGISSQAGWSNRIDSTLDAIDGAGELKRYPLSSLGGSEPWLSVYIDQMLFDLGHWRQVERTELEADVAAVAEADQQERISFAVLDRYLTVLRLEQVSVLAAERVREAEWLDRQAAALLDAGRALPGEREQVALALDELRLAAAADARELDDARRTLWEAISGEEGGPPIFELVPDSVPAVAQPADGANDEALRDAPELRILDLRRRMEEITLAAARAERLPTLSVRGGYFHYGTKRFDAFEDELAVGVDLKVPVFSGFRTSSNIEGASLAAEAARLRYEATRESKRTRVRELARRLAATQKQPELARRRADVARERVRLADLGLQAQRGTLAAALVARADAARDALTAIDAHFERIMLWASLQRETGRLAAALTGGEPTAAAP